MDLPSVGALLVWADPLAVESLLVAEVLRALQDLRALQALQVLVEWIAVEQLDEADPFAVGLLFVLDQ